MAQHRGQLRPHVPIGYVRGAHPAGEHLADDFAGPWERVWDLLDSHRVKRNRAGYLHVRLRMARTVALSTGRATPCSVTRAVIILAGVTSKAGLRHGVSAMVRYADAAWRTSPGSRSSIVISPP